MNATLLINYWLLFCTDFSLHEIFYSTSPFNLSTKSTGYNYDQIYFVDQLCGIGILVINTLTILTIVDADRGRTTLKDDE